MWLWPLCVCCFSPWAGRAAVSFLHPRKSLSQLIVLHKHKGAFPQISPQRQPLKSWQEAYISNEQGSLWDPFSALLRFCFCGPTTLLVGKFSKVTQLWLCVCVCNSAIFSETAWPQVGQCVTVNIQDLVHLTTSSPGTCTHLGGPALSALLCQFLGAQISVNIFLSKKLLFQRLVYICAIQVHKPSLLFISWAYLCTIKPHPIPFFLHTHNRKLN